MKESQKNLMPKGNWRVLITGMKGVVGTKLAAILREKGHRVYGCDIKHTEDKSCKRADVANYRELENVIASTGPDIVYHCAAEFGRWNGEDHYEKVWTTNAIGTKNIINICRDYKINLVHFSSSEVYGDYDRIMHEGVMDIVPIRQMNDYAMSKWVNEQQILNEPDLKCVRVRLFNTYGPGEWYHPYRSVNCVFTYNLLTGEPIVVYKGHTRSSTYIDDCVNALANIASNFKEGEVYNIGSNYEHTIEELAENIIEATEADKSLVRYLDKPEGRTTRYKKIDNTKAVNDLQFETTVSLKDGVFKTVEWMRKYYDIR